MTAVRNFLNYRRYREALTALSGIPEAERGARWQYYSAIANHGAGNRMAALQHAERAASMEPDNEEYQELLEQLRNPGRAYTAFGNEHERPLSFHVPCAAPLPVLLLLNRIIETERNRLCLNTNSIPSF